MIITCPNCHTKYQLAEKAIGSAGRKVQCAHCRQSWLAHADPLPEAPKPEKPRLVKSDREQKPDSGPVDAAREDALDSAFEAEAAKADLTRPGETDQVETEADADMPVAEAEGDAGEDQADQGEQRKRLRALRKRQARLIGKLPLARLRRIARYGALSALVGLIAGGIGLRNEIVRAFPDLGGVYQAVGLGVNAIGLEFGDVKTLRTLREGRDVMMISARIRNVTNRNAAIPPVRVSILGGGGEVLYQWTARPPAQFLGPGEGVDFETQLNSAPQGAASVRLVFAEVAASIAGPQQGASNGAGK